MESTFPKRRPKNPPMEDPIATSYNMNKRGGKRIPDNMYNGA